MAIITSPTPDISGNQNVNEKIEALLNSYYMLRKEIEFALQHIGISNLGTDLTKKISSAEGKITTYAQAEMPATGNVGDLWIDTNDSYKLYRHNGVQWISAADTRIDSVVDEEGNLMAAKIAGIINTAVAMVQNSTGQVKFDDRGFIVHDQATEELSTKALLLSSGGILIANSKDVNGDWEWKTAITGDSINADTITSGTLKAININGVNITGSTILVQHDDNSSTRIDGSGITRIFSVPIFEQLPSGTDIIETFESGVLAETRVDRINSWIAFYSEWGSSGSNLNDSNIQDYITPTTSEKYSGLYGLRIENGGIIHGSTGLMCYFINYRPTKDTVLSLKYKTVLSSGSFARMDVKDMDTPGGATTSVALNSSAWATASIALSANVTYRLGIYLENHSDSSSIKNSIFVDDIIFEEDVNEPVIVGYTQSEHPYYDFTYIKKATFAVGESQLQIILPDYFKGLNFDVYLTPPHKWEYYWRTDDEFPSLELLSINNTIPSFTVSCSRYPTTSVVDFLYTVVLNN